VFILLVKVITEQQLIEIFASLSSKPPFGIFVGYFELAKDLRGTQLFELGFC